NYKIGIIILALLTTNLFVACERKSDSNNEKESISQEEGAELEQNREQKEEKNDTKSPKDSGPPGPAVYFTAGLKGYTEPCGCTADILLGGIDRITALVDDGKKLHDSAIFIDAGDWLFEHATLEEHLIPQERAKTEVLIEVHKELGT